MDSLTSKTRPFVSLPARAYETRPGRLTISGAPEGYDVLLLAALAKRAAGPLLHVARDDARMRTLADALEFFAPEIPVLRVPAWDCLPFDRMSPRAEIASARLAALSVLARRTEETKGALIVLTTVNAALQKVPPREVLAGATFSAHVGNDIEFDDLIAFLNRNGYARASTVMEPGDYAVRGGLIDIFPPGAEEPLRIDLFGNTLESVRSFDPDSQRTTGQLRALELVPVTEVLLDEESVQRFRRGYVAAFGAVTDDDPFYEAMSAGRKYQGMEHWLPLFYEKVETLFDYVPGAVVTLDPLADESREERLDHIKDYYEARAETGSAKSSAFGAPRYKPLPPDALYLTAEQWAQELSARPVRAFSPFKAPEGPDTVDAGGARGRNFAPERKREGINVFDALATHIDDLHKSGRRVMIACWSAGSRERMATVLDDHGVEAVETVPDWRAARKLGPGSVALAVLGLEHGFETRDLAVIGEQDVLGDRLIRRNRGRRAANFLTEASSLAQGDLVVHVDHGIGRYEGLRTIDVAGAPHDCLEIVYHGGDKLLLPVENIELLSRYGTDDGSVHLDKLGGHNWQARKARLKERIRDMAERLIKVAAERALKPADAFYPEQGLYEEFSARFPYEETEDQDRSIADVIDDLGKATPMDRLVCGDVGFGKTEVALRAAFVAAMSGKQVAMVVPTTLLARQHYQTFTDRFAGWPLTIRQLSRMVGVKLAAETRKGLADGDVDIVIGTHALLSKTIRFKNLGLLIVDEEQHFGVAHKERIKQLKSNVHVLTLTATPIPRTLQLAMSGIKDLSIIATPPVDRLAIRTFVSPFDPVVVREALLREHYRGGQSFFVCPRISDLREVAEFLDEQVPEVKYVLAHGQMAPGRLEDIMSAFYDGKYDVLVSTTIVESGLDIPTANTLIVHRADMMGLAQLYQIRGRIGRSKQRGYAYLTVPPRRTLTANAEKRLKVLQSLDTLGAGFTLASHDLDIRGAGNLLGEEQSGHVREVGVELYQAMLEEAVANLRSGDLELETSEAWSPHINVGTSVLIPEDYVEDLNVRLSLYRRLADLERQEDIEAFAAELIDRFGPLPEEVNHLLAIIAIKGLCRAARVSKVDAGPKGITLTFRPDGFPNVAGLVDLVSNARTPMKLKPDGKLVYLRGWEEPRDRLDGTHRLLSDLAKIAGEPEPKAA